MKKLQPEEILIMFIEDMHKWEKDCATRFFSTERSKQDSGSEYRIRLEKMNIIFTKYCTGKSRVDGRTGEFGIPPEYNPESEHIIETIRKSDHEVIICTEQTAGLKVKNRYKMLLIDGEWLIDKKEWKPQGRPWEKAYL